MKTAYSFRFGTLLMEYEKNTLNKLYFGKENYIISEEDIAARSAFSDMVMKQVEEFLEGKRKRFDLRYELKGTDFQKKVWDALLTIPYGKCRTYKQIAEQIGNPKASRAVGMANNKNPILLIVPCHRVIGADGSLTGYAGGIEMKQYLLDLEKDCSRSSYGAEEKKWS